MQEQELSKGWKYQQVNGDLSGEAKVPGTIHTDLLNENKIEDPFYRTNEKDLQWIDKEDWEYSTLFEISATEFNKENIILDFKGLDTYADVYFNNKLVLKADNMFREWEIDIKNLALLGTNTLKIYFHSPISKGLALLDAEGHGYPASNDQSENGEIGNQKVSVFTRKAGYHYGWDWGPRFVTSGIWRPIILKAWDSARISDTYIKQSIVNKENAELIADISIESNNDSDAKLIILNQTDNKTIIDKDIKLSKGSNVVSIPFNIKNPKLWWSAGLGTAHLYDFEIQVLQNNKIISKQSVSTGLRDLKLIREKDEEGESFTFQLNGVKIFAKGANYIPNDNFLPRVSNENYKKVIADAVNANMNMLRVWGGGIYENDYFYELCDKNGILVWQDFMFACSMYPGNPEFLENVKQEAIGNVKRLRNHPSIALWCGNNEINSAWKDWGWKNSYTKELQDKLQTAYLDIFHKVLPDVVAEYTFNDDYWPSSPQAGYEADQHASIESSSGDFHYWGVWHGLHPFEDFEVNRARFMSEYGFQSFPDFETVQTYALPEDYDIESDVMAAHQRSGIGNLRIKEYMSWYFNVPQNFEDFLYMSHVLQAYGMRMGIEAHRRAMPYCMGSLYWQINDTWQVASWSSTDYFHKWKAMHFEVKRAYEKTILSATRKNNMLEIYGITDELKNIDGLLKLQLIAMDGTVIKELEIESTIKANTSTLLFQWDEMEASADSTKVALFCRFTKDESVKTENTFYFCKPKDQKLLSPQFIYEFKTIDDKTYLEIESDKLARYVFLNVPGQNEFFVDNYFDLMPKTKKRIEIQNLKSAKKIELQIKHLQLIN